MASPTGLHRKRTKVTGAQLMAVSALPEVAVQRQQAVPLTPLLIEAFAAKYLWARYDNPLPTPTCHREWWAWYCGPEETKALAAPRGHAKSTALTHAGTLASTLFRNRSFGVLGSATYPQACEFLAAITNELMENEDLQRDFEIKAFDRAREDDLIVRMRDGHKFRLVAKGIDQPIRGLKWGSKRPDLFNLDDIEDDEAVESKDRRDKLANRVMNSLLPAGSDNAIIRLYGTVMHYDSFLENSLKDPEWHGVRYRAHHSYDNFSSILWMEKFSEARLRNVRQKFINKGNPDGYAQEYLNEPVSEQDAYFLRTDLQPMPEGFMRRVADHDIVLRKYAGWDFAVSKDTKADYSVWVVVGVDQEGNKYVLDMDRGRWDSQELVAQMLRVEKLHRPEFHAVEKGVIEKAIGPWLNDAQRRAGVYLNLLTVPIHKDKRIRGRPWQGATRARHVFYNKDSWWYESLEAEMVRFPKGEHDDIVDAQTILGMVLEDLVEGPSEEEFAEDIQHEYEALEARVLAVGRSRVTGY